MTFIIILIALIIERFFHWTQLRHWGWFDRYQHFLNVRFANRSNYFLLAALVIPPVLLVGLIQCLLNGWLYYVPKILFGIVVLIYCLGPSNLWVQIYNCMRAFNKDDPADAVEQVKTAFGVVADQPQAFHQAFTRAIFVAANARIFAVLFWFVLLGPLGAVLYRAISISATNASSLVGPAALQVLKILDWLPVRLFTFLFALGGHFTKVFSLWQHHAKEGLESNNVMLGDCGIAALDVAVGERIPEDGKAENEALVLLDRVLVMGLVLFAIVILLVR